MKIRRLLFDVDKAALAYCQAIETASGCQVPTRARQLRVLLAKGSVFTDQRRIRVALGNTAFTCH